MLVMNLSFNFNFDGHCRAAFSYYEKVLGGDIQQLFLYSDSPNASSLPNELQDKVMHGSVNIGNIELVGSDVMEEQYKKPEGFFILLSLDSSDKVKQIFADLSVDGEVLMSPETTFWSSCYAMVIDQFGIPWKLNCSS